MFLWLITLLCNQTLCCFFVCVFVFPVRVMVCVEGVNISDSEDEDESRCHFLSFRFNVNLRSQSAVVHLVSYLTIVFCWSAPCKKKQKKTQPLNCFFFCQIFLETLINVTRPCRSSPDMFHRKSFIFVLFQQFLLSTNELLLQFRFFLSCFFSTSHFLMPIFQEKFPFIQKSSRTLVRYTYTKIMRQENNHSTYGICPDVWLGSKQNYWKIIFTLHHELRGVLIDAVLSSTGVLCPQPSESDCVHTVNQERHTRSDHWKDAPTGC